MSEREVPDYLRGVPSPIWREIDSFFGYDEFRYMTVAEIKAMALGLRNTIVELSRVCDKRDAQVAQGRWDRYQTGDIHKNSVTNVFIAFQQIGWETLDESVKVDVRSVIALIEKCCGYAPNERVTQKVIDEWGDNE